MELNVLRADPAGNITLFVLDSVPREERGALSARLMALPGSDVEQVGFVCPPLHEGTAGRMEMAGGEFCGNATRAFGMLAAQEGQLSQVLVEVSGCDHPVTVEVNWSARTARAQMPLPRAVSRTQVDGCPGTLVDLGGIAHLVVEDVPPFLDFFQRAEPLFADIPGLDAYGVIFLNGERMTPLVKVPAANSLVWEGSCGSGSLAAAAAQSQTISGGPFVRDYIQPAGTVQAAVVRREGKIVSASIGGPVRLDAPALIEL